MDGHAVYASLFVVGAFGLDLVEGFKFEGAIGANNAAEVVASLGDGDFLDRKSVV